jgi:hypothetical protein
VKVHIYSSYRRIFQVEKHLIHEIKIETKIFSLPDCVSLSFDNFETREKSAQIIVRIYHNNILEDFIFRAYLRQAANNRSICAIQ